MGYLKHYLNDFIQLFFPEVCVTCGQKLITQEKQICLNCLYDLPLTNFHKMPDNMMEQLFWGRVRIERATAWFYFRKGSKYQRLIHYLKYKGMKEIGQTIGILFGNDLKDEPVFANVDFIVPVPLHPKKLKKRGYNQSEWIAYGISQAIYKPVETENLKRLIFTKTQTRKTRYERWENVEDIFELKKPEEFENKHILLIDDVATTGSTLEACVIALQKSPKIKISIATLAFANI